MGSGLNHVAAGLVAALALPAETFWLGLPFPAALPVAVAVYAGIAFLLAPRRTVERIASGRVGTGQADLVASLIEDGEAAVGRLRAAARGLRGADGRDRVAHLAEVAQSLLDRLAAEPGKLPAVRRFLTYYLPRSAEIAEGLGTLERQRVPDAGRQTQIGATLAKLDGAFTFYVDGFARADLDALDVELKLLDQSLAEDLAPATVPRGRP